MTVTETTTRAVCPACQKPDSAIDHLLGTEMRTWWYCDACGGRYSLVFSKDGVVDIQVAPGRLVKTWDVLVLKPQEKPVYFVVEGMRLWKGEKEPDTAEDIEHKQFFYEEHSCPTNWLKPQMVYYDGDSDPHGLIHFVSTRDANALPPDESHGPNALDTALTDLIETHVSSAQKS